MPAAPSLSLQLLVRLKAQTREEHAAMEGTLGLMRDDLTLGLGPRFSGPLDS